MFLLWVHNGFRINYKRYDAHGTEDYFGQYRVRIM